MSSKSRTQMSSTSLDFYPFLKISHSLILSKFLHDCVDDLIGGCQMQFHSYNNDIEWTFEDYNIAKRCIQSFYMQCAVKNNFELTVSDLSKSIHSEIENCYNLRKEDIFQYVVEEHILQNGHNLVRNFDWKLKWVLGSSKLASLREPVLQVDLSCIQLEDDIKRSNGVSFETDCRGLDNLISELERVDVFMDIQ